MSGTIIALDWGTSSLRAFRLARGGAILAQRTAPKGILTVPTGGFEAVLNENAGDWLAADPGAPLLLSGMVGSRQGWIEVPYAEAPADTGALLAKAVRHSLSDGRQAVFLPGVACQRGGVPDVMRGEETQIIGALALAGLTDGIVCTPGTHSKWVTVAGGAIQEFATFMTGELFAVLRDHSLLGRGFPRAPDGRFEIASADLAAEGFRQGVAHAFADPALLRSLFSTRTLGLFNRLPPVALPDYLSGLLIGAEIAAALPEGGGHDIPVIATAGLAERYRVALAQRGYAARVIAGEDAAAAGLAAFAALLTEGTPA